jgi:hypothetical protein
MGTQLPVAPYACCSLTETASSGARTGVVTLIQRFVSALNLNIHLHMLILDGGNSRTELLS